ncbi:MAG: hypothetical protein IKE59_08060 [Erysipelotrichaceae bacterium]|nr:hypothetical protein [Erysipelotrichaceae bacterium]
MSLSRVRKNEELYRDLNTNPEENIQSEELSHYANRLNAIDSSSFDKMEAEATSSEAQHLKEQLTAENPEVIATKIPEVKKEEVKETVKEEAENAAPAFNNEYLDEFIDEVKQYNIRKGLRSMEDTDLNILNELRGNSRKNTVNYFREKEEESTKAFEPFKEKEPETVKETLKEDLKATPAYEPRTSNLTVYGPLEDDEPKTQPQKKEEASKPLYQEDHEDLRKEIENVLSDVGTTREVSKEELREASKEPQKEKKMVEVEEDFIVDTKLHENLLQQTSELKTKIDEYDDKLGGVNEKVDTVNKVLNGLLTVLLIVLVAVLGVLVYYILKSRGII